ncbi:MAG: adenylate cyclase, partial [Caulobacteraceae bacterium]
MATLQITSPEGNARSVELERTNTLGRHPDNSIQLLDRIVSKNHCIVALVDNGYVLEDLGSLNGTYINGERVEGKRALRPGDEIVVGSTRIRFDGAASTDTAESLPTGAQGKVTMAPGMVESHVRARLSQQGDQNFVPETLIDDTAVRRDYEKLRASYELTRAIAGELDVNRLLEKILTTAFELLSADRGVVLLLDDNQRPQPRCVRTKRPGVGEEVALSSTIIGEVLRDRSAVLSSDALMDARFKGAQSIIM